MDNNPLTDSSLAVGFIAFARLIGGKQAGFGVAVARTFRALPTPRAMAIAILVNHPQLPLANGIEHPLGGGVVLIAEGGLAQQNIHQLSLHLAANPALSKDLIDDGFKRLAGGFRHSDDLRDLRLCLLSPESTQRTVTTPLVRHDSKLGQR